MNMKEQLASKIETVDAILKYLEELKKTSYKKEKDSYWKLKVPGALADNTQDYFDRAAEKFDPVDAIKDYLNSMKENYKEAYGIVSKQVRN